MRVWYSRNPHRMRIADTEQIQVRIGGPSQKLQHRSKPDFTIALYDSFAAEPAGQGSVYCAITLYGIVSGTRAVPGPLMLINDFQGVPSLPESIDNDFITSQGTFPQPLKRISVIAGFISVCRMFRILSEHFFHHRCIISDLRTVTVVWTVDTEDRLHQILREMPNAIQDPMINETGASRQYLRCKERISSSRQRSRSSRYLVVSI